MIYFACDVLLLCGSQCTHSRLGARASTTLSRATVPRSPCCRDAARARQREARRDLTNHARKLALGGEGGGASSPFGENTAGHGSDAFSSFQVSGEDADVVDVDIVGDDIDRASRGMTDAMTNAGNGSSHSMEQLNRGRSHLHDDHPKHRRSNSAPGKWSFKPHAEFSDGQFMQPEWMVDVPLDLADAWFVTPRPVGQRCLVIASRGQTVSRVKTGRVLHVFPSALPGGSKITRHGEGAFCILDCVFHEADGVYYAMDCLAWNGMSLYDCTAEMRLSWLHAKLGDPLSAECEAANEPSAQHRYRFAVPPTQRCDVEGLVAAYQAPMPFTRDGLLFLAKDGNYELGVSPLAMLWKDATCSEYVIDTNPDGSVPARQKIVLSLRATTGDVLTGDIVPVPLARLPAAFITSAGHVAADYEVEKDVGSTGSDAGEGNGVNREGRGGWRGKGGLRDGLLLRFAVGDSGLTIKDGLPVAADLIYEGIANQRRGGGADSLTKILFQYNARRDPLTIQEIGDAITRAGETAKHPSTLYNQPRTSAPMVAGGVMLEGGISRMHSIPM